MLNETNITIVIAKVLLSTPNETNNSWGVVSQIIIPAIAIIVSGLISYYSIKSNMKSIYIQANQTEIKTAMEELSKKIERRQSQEILEFLNSINGIYVPKPIEIKIRNKCSVNWLSAILFKRTKLTITKEEKNKIIQEIRKYLSP